MFNDWLLEQLRKRQWSQADLSRHSGLTKGAVSNYINGRIPDKTALRQIAKAFNLPPEDLFRAAGLLPPQSPENELINEINHLTSELPPQEQQDILEFIKLRHRLSKERGKNATRKTANHTAPIK